MSLRSISVMVAVVGLIGLLAWGLASRNADALEPGEPVGGPALPVLGSEGETRTLADFEGSWVLVNVWASWCVPCEDEAPDIESFYRRYGGEDFEVVGIDTKDASGDGLEFVDEFGLTYPQLHDGSGTFADDTLKATGVPENYLLDPDGDLVTFVRGPVDRDFLEQEIAPLIEGGGAEGS